MGRKRKEKEKNTGCKTYVGGQAVMEGVMMRGKRSMVTAVRDPEGKIQVESERLTPPEKQKKITKIPFLRGVVNFVQSLIVGNRVLMRSADVATVEDDQPTKVEKWLAEKHKVDVNGIFNFIAMFIGIALAILIFIWALQKLTELTGFEKEGLDGLWFNLIEGGIRLGIFVLYILFMSCIKTLRRVFMYHGAEHKTITCYERGMDLTVENVKKCSRVHDRCGTTFLFIVMVVSILVFSLANFVVGRWIYTDNKVLDSVIRIVFKLLMLPVVAGVSYEILKGLAKTKSKFFLIFKAPGLLLQRLTTREPEDGMIECAITAFKGVLEMDEDPNIPTRVFATAGKMSELLATTKKRFKDNGIDEDEAEWIFALSLDMPKSAVAGEERILKLAQVKKIVAIADERLTGKPLWYVIGDTSFYGYTIKVDGRVLIPRPETEELAQKVIGIAEEGDKILDLCTGSGAIAIAVYKELEKSGRKAEVYASDISADALEVAKKNAELNEAEITFIQSDLFSRIRNRFNIIVTNPPYIPTDEIASLQREVRDYEPHLALDGGKDGMDYYRRIAADATKYLARGGVLIMEVGSGEAQQVAKLFKYCQYSMVIKDFAGIDRYVKIVI
ncbi:MAG: peptide chain release factor N(5)-glutamine methyltransferase [Clostridia bacterium]|nr:peptide chain release factor N(5)-glutamine methyltransferase [Clostridia bacterium]